MKGQHYGSIRTIQEAVAKELKFIPISAFETAFHYWHSRWKRLDDVERPYFEDY